MNDFAVIASEYLKFNVARLLDVALEEKSIVTERFHRFATCRLNRGLQLAAITNDFHALPAAARRGFDQKWQVDTFRLACERCIGLILAVVTRHYRDAKPMHEMARFGFGAHRRNR